MRHALLLFRRSNSSAAARLGNVGFMASALFAVFCICPILADEPDKKEPPPRDERLNRETPEGALRVFTLGVMFGVEDLIKKTSLPVSEEEMKLICTKPPEGSPGFKEIKELIASMKIRPLKAGDKFTLPGNKEITVGKDEVSDDRLVLVLGDAPVPTRMYKAKGFWWVDPEPLIHARKAAAAKPKETTPKSTNK